MKPDRWHQVSQIFEAALTLEPEERVAYLKEQCRADEALRREVELLLQSHQNADNVKFIDSPAVERAAPLLTPDESEAEESSSRLEPGQRVGHYVVIQRIGAGGMGEVYLAKDTRLDRNVALKILPSDVALDKRRMQRFGQEARVVSALNQPNILTIFEFGEADALHFLASEYIDGQTLRDHLHGSQLKLTEILDISTQIMAALDAAHEAKIVHRDIKPENVMIRRRDHIVKVLDFGLAKLTETKTSPQTGAATDTEAPTEFKSKPGSVMGTINYMSPEQSQGLTVDERTDIWSTGVVIYEMVAGRMPFKGATSSHTIVEIIEKDPASLSQSAPGKVPPELERIVRKALAKSPEERYQTAKDMLIDLRNLRKRLEFELEIERSGPPDPLSASSTAEQTVPAITAPAPARMSVKHLEPLRKRLVLGLSVAAVALVVLVLGANAWRARRSSVVTFPPVPASTSERQLTYWMTVQKYRAGKPFENPFTLAGEVIFEKDYRVRLSVRIPQAGYLYILNEGPPVANSFPFVVLFPSPTANSGSALLPANQEVQIPERSWLRFDAQEGTKKLWLVFSADAVRELEAVKRFANPKDKGVINEPDLSESVKAFLASHSATRPTVKKAEEEKATNITAPGNLLVHLIRLEHH